MRLFEIEFAYRFLGGFYLAISLLHLILYIYNRERTANLIYSGGMGLAFINFALVPISREPGYFATLGRVNSLLDLASSGALLYFVAYYIIFSTVPYLRRIVKGFGWIYMAGVCLLAVSLRSGFFPSIDLILRTALYLVVGVTCTIGLVKRIPNFWLIVSATCLLILTNVFLSADLLNLWGHTYVPSRVIGILLGYTMPFLFYSTYLSKDLALTSKRLVREHIMNERLTTAKFEQEQLNRKILEEQNIALERSVEERTYEISLQKEKIKAQAEKIQEIDKLKSRFFANVSHEFRTPLTLILGLVQKRLKEARDTRDVREYTTVIQNANRLLHLVNQLLDLARLESGTLSLRRKRVEWVSFLRVFLEGFHSLAEARNIRYHIHYPLFTTAVTLDEDKIETVVTNLLSNAFKFTPAGGEVTVTVQSTAHGADPSNKGYAEIIVQDTGIGIAQDNLQRIFERFYQVEGAVMHAYEGTGIGLAITKELVELHGGTIQVASEPGLGSRFVVRLPLEGDANESAVFPGEASATTTDPLLSQVRALVEEPETAMKPEREKVLVVEDNADLRYYLSENLSARFQVVLANNGEEALRCALAEVPDLIVSDVMMPGIDGLELCRRIKGDERTSHIPFVLLTAKMDIDTRLESLGLGADDYLPKPFDIDELLARLQNLIETRRKLREKFTQHLSLRPRELNVPSMEERFLEKVRDVMEAHIADAGFGVEPFSREVGMSAPQLYRKLIGLTGLSPNEFIRQFRLQRAADLLTRHVGNVAEVAYQTGFTNLSYFAKCFKEKYGTPPSTYTKAV